MSKRKPKFSESDAEYIRKAYGLPCVLHAPVEFRGRRGQVVGTDGQYIIVQLDGEPKPTGPCHPKWEMVWLNKEASNADQ